MAVLVPSGLEKQMSRFCSLCIKKENKSAVAVESLLCYRKPH